MVLVSPAVLEEGNYQSMNGVVGTGPYVYEEIVDGDYVRFVRNENYWGEQPYYDEVIVKYIPDASARLQALQSGEIDLIYGSALLTWDDYQQATSLPISPVRWRRATQDPQPGAQCLRRSVRFESARSRSLRHRQGDPLRRADLWRGNSRRPPVPRRHPLYGCGAECGPYL